MFSYTGLSKAAVERLRNEFSVYAVDSGQHLRGRAPALRNINHVADAVAKVADD